VSGSLHSYGGHRSQVAELLLPAGLGPHPVCVLVHGGCWRQHYDRHLMDSLAADLADRGWAAWNVEYRRVGLRAGGGWPETGDDVAAAVDHLAEVEGPLDLARVAAVGHSAGGHLALWATGREDAGVPVTAVVGQAAVSDLDAAAAQGVCGGMVERLLGGPPNRVPDRYRAASPARRLPLTTPALLVHGDRDDTVPVAMSRDFAAAAGCELAELAGDGHYEHLEPHSRAWATVTEWLERH
jgi:dipeptidyl aminopeptidase/acylaminoacyl peptidase